ncbi:hypothetical protein, partial [Limosilactobacillus fermentum]
ITTRLWRDYQLSSFSYPQETCFKFGIIDSQENLRPLFEFSSTDLWKNIFSNSTEIKIIVFL